MQNDKVKSKKIDLFLPAVFFLLLILIILRIAFATFIAQKWSDYGSPDDALGVVVEFFLYAFIYYIYFLYIISKKEDIRKFMKEIGLNVVLPITLNFLYPIYLYYTLDKKYNSGYGSDQREAQYFQFFNTDVWQSKLIFLIPIVIATLSFILSKPSMKEIKGYLEENMVASLILGSFIFLILLVLLSILIQNLNQIMWS